MRNLVRANSWWLRDEAREKEKTMGTHGQRSPPRAQHWPTYSKQHVPRPTLAIAVLTYFQPPRLLPVLATPPTTAARSLVRTRSSQERPSGSAKSIACRPFFFFFFFFSLYTSFFPAARASWRSTVLVRVCPSFSLSSPLLSRLLSFLAFIPMEQQ
ncbi:hypothetical protein IWZ03DRAFT_163622 [Phyllosticta citriasiana]|uniref:Transmembrane protein n=1 Tax=Phyllosticta citriasiana TaxID=595635 RepID=A0ABR1KQ65_9PEZI